MKAPSNIGSPGHVKDRKRVVGKLCSDMPLRREKRVTSEASSEGGCVSGRRSEARSGGAKRGAEERSEERRSEASHERIYKLR